MNVPRVETDARRLLSFTPRTKASAKAFHRFLSSSVLASETLPSTMASTVSSIPRIWDWNILRTYGRREAMWSATSAESMEAP